MCVCVCVRFPVLVLSPYLAGCKNARTGLGCRCGSSPLARISRHHLDNQRSQDELASLLELKRADVIIA